MKRSSQITLVYSKDEIAAILAKNIQSTQNVTITSFTYHPEDKTFTFVGEEGASDKTVPHLSAEIEKIFVPHTPSQRKQYKSRNEGPTAVVRTLMAEGYQYPINRLIDDMVQLGAERMLPGQLRATLRYLKCEEIHPDVWQMKAEVTKEII